MTFLKRILLVDYEPAVTAMIRKALEETSQYLIKEERDSRQALRAARWFQPDLILFDLVSRPEGAAAAREIQADPSFHSTSVVFLGMKSARRNEVVSGGSLDGYSFSATAANIDEFVRYVAELLNSSKRKTSVHPPAETN